VRREEFFELRTLVQEDAVARRMEERRRVSECEGKHRFDSFGSAQRTIRIDLRKVTNVYHCTVCRGYHIGSVAGHRRKRLKAQRERALCE
jgi:hypothetical protein